MEIKEFQQEARPGKKITVDGEVFDILQVIKFRLDGGSYYFKCFLSGDRVIAEDSEMNVYIFVKPVDTEFSEPIPKKLNFDNKGFKFLFDAKAVAEEVWGSGFWEQGDKEKFWDYEAVDGSYLSLGLDDKTGEKADFYGRKIVIDKVDIK